MSNTILTQIPAPSTSEFHININSVKFNPIMCTVKFINKAILIYFSARNLSIASRALLLNLSLVVEFLRNVFTIFIFDKILSHEALVTGRVAAIGNRLYKQSANAPV